MDVKIGIAALVIIAVAGCERREFTSERTVPSEIDSFMIREKERITTTLTLSGDWGWIQDASGNSRVEFEAFHHESPAIQVNLATVVERSGVSAIGPFQIDFGNDVFRTTTHAVKVLPPYDVSSETFEFVGLPDPNETGLYQVRIDYPRYLDGEEVTVEIRDDVVGYCTDLRRRRSSRSGGPYSAHTTYVLYNVTDEPVTIRTGDYMGVPDGIEVPELVVPPASDSQIRRIEEPFGKPAC